MSVNLLRLVHVCNRRALGSSTSSVIHPWRPDISAYLKYMMATWVRNEIVHQTSIQGP